METHRALSSDGVAGAPRWSPDGRFLFYQINTGESENMFAWEVEGGADPIPLQPTQFDDTVPMISPDGRWLAWAGNDSGRWEVYVTSFPSGGRKWQISNDGDWPRWSRDDTGDRRRHITGCRLRLAAARGRSGAHVRAGDPRPQETAEPKASPPATITCTTYREQTRPTRARMMAELWMAGAHSNKATDIKTLSHLGITSLP